MARYVTTADTVVDGIAWARGSILNLPTSIVALNSVAALGNAIPRVRVAGLEHNGLTHYLEVPATEQLGYQTADGALPDEGTIKEPVLPAANTQYD